MLANEKNPVEVMESIEDWSPKYIDIIAIVFVTTLIVSNIAATKLFEFWIFTFSAGIIIFPISYIFGDILTEVYGFNRARRIIYMGMAANLFTALVLWLAIKLPPAEGWTWQGEFEIIHSQIPRIVLGSVIGYVGGELANSITLSLLKIYTSGRKLWIRTISSTIIGQLIDSALFVMIAFWGSIPSVVIGRVIVSAWVFKVLYEAIATPVTYLIVNRLKKAESVDHFDLKDKYKLI